MSMTPHTRLGIEVEVPADDGHWWPGFLEHWRQRDGHWEGWVRYSTGVGQTHIGWFPAEELRRAQGTGEGT